MTVRARLKGWHFPSVAEMAIGGGRPIRQGVLPTVEDPQAYTLEVTNAERPQGEDYFEFEVHTPETLRHLLEQRVAVLGRGMVVVIDEYDPDRVAETLRPLVESAEADTWEALAFRLGSLGRWEFEGWRWDADAERLKHHRPLEAEVRDVRLRRTAIGKAFSLPIEVRFGATGLQEELTVTLALESPLWILGRSSPGDVVVGSGRVFALEPDAEAIRGALQEELGWTAPSWELLRLALQPLEAPTT